MSRFLALCYAQYEPDFSAQDRAELDLLSALTTYLDRVDKDMLTVETTGVSQRRIEGLRKRFDGLKGAAP